MSECSAVLKKRERGGLFIVTAQKLAVWPKTPLKTGWTAPWQVSRLSASLTARLTGRLACRLVRHDRTGWTAPWQPWWPDCQSDWQTAGQKSEGSETSWTAPQDQFSWSRPESLGEKTPSQLPGGKFSWCMVKEVHSWSWSSAGVESSTQLKSSSAEKLSCSWRSSTQLKLSSAGKLSCSWRSSAAFQQEHSRFLKPNHGQPNNVKVIFGFQK